MKLQASKADLVGRQSSDFDTDKAALSALIQTAVNVELFTIPLYMTSLYSIQGMHQITGNNTLYQGRKWPGLAPTFKPGGPDLGNIKENALAFNTIFSVFVEEMLHLQLASNLANALGVTPVFTQMSPAPGYGWTVYDKNSTILPGIIDFKDCKPVWPEPTSGKAPVHYKDMRVKLDELNQSQNELFLAIEAPEEDAIGRIKPEYYAKYIHTAPFKDWQVGDALPMLGSIGLMYQLIWDYLGITYDDNTTLFEKVYSPGALQQDVFNASSPGHPYREYQGFETTIDGWVPEKAKEVVFKLISAITDQGEGSGIKRTIAKSAFGLQAVQPDYQASELALETNYPSFTDAGKQAPSSHAYARVDNDKKDHYERFLDIRADLESNKIVTWPTWHKTSGGKWKAEDLKTPDYDKNKYPLPKAEDIAGALNRLNDPSGTGNPNDPKRLANYKQFCEIATGAIAGITSVLDNYWKSSSVGFPFPSMGGSGDRLMMCWAVFGQVPDLSVPVQQKQKKALYHACQGIDYTDAKIDNHCASAEIYHNCRGSNSCKGEGGCGFVQQVGESKSCGSSVMSLKNAGPLCGGPKPPQPMYSAPSDNLCASFGGCAVPISASQIYPVISQTGGRQIVSGIMELNDFVKQSDGSYSTVPLPAGENMITFNTGELVHDIAWNSYVAVLASRNPPVPAPEKPVTSDIRMAFPPST